MYTLHEEVGGDKHLLVITELQNRGIVAYALYGLFVYGFYILCEALDEAELSK